MEMKIIPANGGGPGMDGVFLSWYRDGDYTPRPRSGPLPSLPAYGKFTMDEWIKARNTQKVFIHEFPSFQIPYFLED